MPLTIVTGEILSISPTKRWVLGTHEHVSGKMESHRIEAKALDIMPLELRDEDVWDPEEHYWGEDDEPLEDWAKPIALWGPRPAFEMEQVIPGFKPDSWDPDPVSEAAELNRMGYCGQANGLFHEMLIKDLRCLDAYAHLGLMAFDSFPQWAIRYYEMGLRIGELSFEENFIGVLPWGRIDNRPFLRCIHGFGLCLWRLGRRKEAEEVFQRMLWLNPSDNQGAGFLLNEICNGKDWEKE